MIKTKALKISQIKEMALYFREKYNIRKDSYFPILEVIYDFFEKGLLNFEIVDECNEDNVVGKYDYITNTIKVRSDVVEEYYANIYRSNFTLAHEFFHYVQAKILNFSFCVVDNCNMYENSEWQANEFAGQLLITQEYTHLSEEVISQMFHVSIECALTRKVKKLNRLDKYKKVLNNNPELTNLVIETLVDGYKDLSLTKSELLKSNLEKSKDMILIASYVIGKIYPNEIDVVNVCDKVFEYSQIKNLNKKKYYHIAVGTMLLSDNLDKQSSFTYLLNKYGYDEDLSYVERMGIEFESKSVERLSNVIKSCKYLIKDRAKRAISDDDKNLVVYANNKMFIDSNYLEVLNVFNYNEKSYTYLKCLVCKSLVENDINKMRNVFNLIKAL